MYDSEEFDFNPSTSSKLASLFGNTKLSDELDNSLTYTAPKQPKVKKEEDLTDANKRRPSTSVIIAKVVLLWKLEDKNYKGLGKHGLAVIGSTELNLFEIIAYKEKNNILLKIKICNTLMIYNKSENFSSFFDNENQNWLVKFDDYDSQNKFCEIIQKYGCKIQYDSNTPESANKRTENLLREKENIETEPLFVSNVAKSPEKDGDANSDSSGSQKRASILNRMAKMGQQILPNPLLKNASTDISDSELEELKNDRKISPRKVKRAIALEKPVVPKNDSVAQAIPHNYFENQMVPSQGNNNYHMQMPVPQSIGPPMMYSSPMQYDGFSSFMVAQNTELKMNLAQISAKLDCVLNQSGHSSSKVDETGLKSKNKVLELRIANLQSELENYERKYSNLTVLYTNLEEKYKDDCVKCKENIAVIQGLKNEIAGLKIDIKVGEENIAARNGLESELKNCRTKVEECEKTIEMQISKIYELEQFYEKHKNVNDLQITINDLNKTVDDLRLQLEELEDYKQKSEGEKQKNMSQTEKNVNTFNNKIKEHMNNMYQSVLINFDENSVYSLRDFNASLAKNLKNTTFKIIEELENIYGKKNFN